MVIIGKAAAKSAGLPRYFTGVACENGHIAERRTKGGACVLCRRAAAREYMRRHRANPDFLVADQRRTREWRASAAGQKWIGRYIKARWETNRDNEEFRETQRQSVRKWQAAIREKQASMDAMWRADYNDSPSYKERNRVRVVIRIARKRASPGCYTVADVAVIYERQAGLCACGCGGSIADRRYHIDHILPLCRGGTNWPDNIQLLAPACNLSKASRTMEEWIAARAVPNGEAAGI